MMGGIHGHLQHPYENRSLTFYDLKGMLSQLGSGSIEAHEKTDGINLYVSWDFEPTEQNKKGSLKVARNKSHIKSNGLDREGLEAKFAGRGMIKDAFVNAYDVLSMAFSSMTQQTLVAIFGATGGIWYSLDIIYPEARNLIQYDGKHLIFHKSGTVLFDWDGNPMECRTDRHFKMLELVMVHLNEAVESTGWILHAPKTIQLKPMNPAHLQKQMGKLDGLLKYHRIQDGDTINDYLRRRLRNDLSSFLFVPTHLRDKLLDRLLGVPGAPTPNAMCKGQVPVIANHIKGIARVAPNVIRAAMGPLEEVVHAISCALLGGCQSAFVKDGGAEVQRLRGEIGKALGALHRSEDEKAGETARRHTARLQSPDKINTAVEGVVFPFKRQHYKLTGNFAPANQLYGYVKYKLNPVRETAKDEVLSDYILSVVAG